MPLARRPPALYWKALGELVEEDEAKGVEGPKTKEGGEEAERVRRKNEAKSVEGPEIDESGEEAE